MGSILKMVI